MNQKSYSVAPDAHASPVLRTHNSRQRPGRRDVMLQSRPQHRAVAPVVSISADEAQRIIDAAQSTRDRLLLSTLWQTGCRISEALALRGCDIEPDTLWLRNLKNGPDAYKQVPLPCDSHLTAELALYQKQQQRADDECLFVSRQHSPLSRAQAWRIVKQASTLAGVTVRALRASDQQSRGDRVPVWCHVLRHSRAMQTLRHTDVVTAQQVLGHSSLSTTSRYLRYSIDELKRRVQQVPE